MPSDDLLSQDPAVQVPSALKSLTSVFGMGTGVTFSPLSLDMVGPRGFELPTSRLSVVRSSQLSYGPSFFKVAELTGFEPAVSRVTGGHVRPLHHSSMLVAGTGLEPAAFGL